MKMVMMKFTILLMSQNKAQMETQTYHAQVYRSGNNQ